MCVWLSELSWVFVKFTLGDSREPSDQESLVLKKIKARWAYVALKGELALQETFYAGLIIFWAWVFIYWLS